jgi:hypothetical protein
VPEYYTAPKVAVAPQQAGVKLAWCWTHQTAITNPSLSSIQTVSNTQIGGYYRAPTSRTYRIVSGDGSALLLVDLDMPEADDVRADLPDDYSVGWSGLGFASLLGSSNSSLRPMLLPTGTDGVGVLVLAYQYAFLSQLLGAENPGDAYSEFYRATYANHRMKCFLVGPSSIRELSVPTAFDAAIQAASTPWVIADGVNPVGPALGISLPPQPQIVASPTYYTPPSGDFFIDHGWWASTGISWFASGDSVASPLEYQRLNRVEAYTPPAVTIWVEPDFTASPGMFLDYWGEDGSGLLAWDEAINLKQPMQWRGRAYPRGGAPGTQNAGDLPSAPALTRSISASASVPAPEGGGGYRMHLSHDFGQTAQCRASLLALGFTPADLQP